VEIVNVAEPGSWLEEAGPGLVADEARHNLILGLAGTLRDRPGLYAEHELWLVRDGRHVAASALRTPPYNLVLGDGTRAGLDALAGAVGGTLPGVVGAVPEVDAFVAPYERAHGVTVSVGLRQGIYALDEVVPPEAPPGRARLATAGDRELVVRWWKEFAHEALGELDDDEERIARAVDSRLAGGVGHGIALWEDGGEPVSLVAWGSPTPNGIRIGPVYTPSGRRGRGYASALTAHVSQEQLDSGRTFCFLYTDLANPTSNKIYVAIGYRRVCDSVQYTFA
jgi:GNAT superfamily N-acetyltransferase